MHRNETLVDTKKKCTKKERKKEDVEGLRSANTLIAQAHNRAGCMRATVSPAGVRLPKHAPVTETVRLYGPFCGLSGDLVRWRMAGGEVDMARPSAMRVRMHGQPLYTADECICRLPASCQPSAGWCAVLGPRHEESARRQAWCIPSARRQACCGGT